MATHVPNESSRLEPESPRLGFCCKFIPPDPKVVDRPASDDLARSMNVTTVTMAYLTRLGPSAAYDKLAAVVAHNLDAIHRQIAHVARRPQAERLLRLASSILPGYTHPVYAGFYADTDLRTVIEAGLARAGALARETGVRLSMHPGQFCVIASQNEAAVQNGIAELEYHAEVMSMAGFGEGWHPNGAHVNIHGGARAPGVEGFRAGLTRLSRTARNLVTVENDEVMYGLDDLLPLADALPIVLDLHHHWIASRGEYIEPDDPRIARIVESWRGVRPVSHISVSREDLLEGHDPDRRPDFEHLIAAGITPKDLRGHSDMMWNTAVNTLVGRHLAWSDFEIEAKFKNLASEQIARQIAASV